MKKCIVILLMCLSTVSWAKPKKYTVKHKGYRKTIKYESLFGLWRCHEGKIQKLEKGKWLTIKKASTTK